MIRRLVQSADFERVLSAPSGSRSAHFALHHLAQGPLPARKPVAKTAVPSLGTDLSTGGASSDAVPVDDLPVGHWLGCVVPKRHARRAVTRNLLKRQIRSVFAAHVAAHAGAFPAGQWLVRLRMPFPVTNFVSARSETLAATARSELEQLLVRAGSRPGQPARP